MNPYELLSKAIVAQACKDYYDYIIETHKTEKEVCKNLSEKGAMLRLIKRKNIIENGLNAKNFFYSDECLFVTDIDPDKMITEIERRAKNDMRNKTVSDFRLIID